MRRIDAGFTLIELLIVVLIIAVLAAIAAPNFLEFQTRAKVSRAKSDMRSLATAIEAYAVDNGEYPLPGDEEGHPLVDYPAGGPIYFETRISPSITTPVAYISQRLNEPFPGRGAENAQFHYSTREYALTSGGEGSFFRYVDMLQGPASGTQYYLLSHGPDRDHDSPGHDHEGGHAHEEEEAEEHGGGVPALYDPTNGTVSNGDVVFFGPGAGYRD